MTVCVCVYQMQEMYDMIMKHKRAMQDMQLMWEKAIRNHQHEYDSDEELDPEAGTWEHRLRQMEMEKTRGQRSPPQDTCDLMSVREVCKCDVCFSQSGRSS